MVTSACGWMEISEEIEKRKRETQKVAKWQNVREKWRRRECEKEGKERRRQ